MSEQIKSAKDLKVYKKAYDLSMEIFAVSKKFPADERFGLTSTVGDPHGQYILT